MTKEKTNKSKLPRKPLFRNLNPAASDVFGQISIGNDLFHPEKLIKILLKKGLIEKSLQPIMSEDNNSVLLFIPRYEIPIPVHIEWCVWCSKNYENPVAQNN